MRAGFVSFLIVLIAIAKEKGVYKGHPVEYSNTSKDLQRKVIYQRVLQMLKDEVPIAEENYITRPTVYQIKKRS